MTRQRSEKRNQSRSPQMRYSLTTFGTLPGTIAAFLSLSLSPSESSKIKYIYIESYERCNSSRFPLWICLNNKICFRLKCKGRRNGRNPRKTYKGKGVLESTTIWLRLIVVLPWETAAAGHRPSPLPPHRPRRRHHHIRYRSFSQTKYHHRLPDKTTTSADRSSAVAEPAPASRPFFKGRDKTNGLSIFYALVSKNTRRRPRCFFTPSLLSQNDTTLGIFIFKPRL